jgi:hypothetical protein
VKWSRSALAPGLLVLPLAAACSSEDIGASGTSAAALTAAGDVDCTATQEPAYSGGQQIGTVDVIKIGDKPVGLKTAHAFLQLREKAEAEGFNISINSGFRSMSEQEYFYNCYKSGSCNNGNLAARPGYSNHQNGRALDIGGDRGSLDNLIRRLGVDWRKTVASEDWHYEYFGPVVDGPCGTTSEQAAPVQEPVQLSGPTEPPTINPPIAVNEPPVVAPPLPPITQPPPSTDPYDQNNPYDPYRQPPVINPDPRTNPDPYGTNPNPYGTNPNPYGTQPNPTGPTPGPIPTLPNGTPSPSSSSSVPSAPSATPATPPRPQTPVQAAPEPDGSYVPPAAGETQPHSKKSKAKPHAIEGGCAITAPGSTAPSSLSLAALVAFVAIALAAVRSRKRSRTRA